MADSQGRTSFRRSLADALATADLRRLQLAWTAASVGGWVFFIVLAVYAYDQGGATAVGAAPPRMVPAGLAAPLAGVIVDRACATLLAITIGRSAVLAGVASVAAGAPLAVVLLLGALFTVLATAHKPAQAALLPSLAHTPRQLAASNAVDRRRQRRVHGRLPAGRGARGGHEHPDRLPGHRRDLRGGVATRPDAARRRPGTPRRHGRGGPARGASGFRTVAETRACGCSWACSPRRRSWRAPPTCSWCWWRSSCSTWAAPEWGWLNSAWGVGGLVGGAAAISLLGRGRLAAGLAGGCLLVGVRC